MKTLIPIVALSFLIAIFVDASYAADVKDKHQEFLKREAEVNNVNRASLRNHVAKNRPNVSRSPINRVSKTLVKNPKGNDFGDINE